VCAGAYALFIYDGDSNMHMLNKVVLVAADLANVTNVDLVKYDGGVDVDVDKVGAQYDGDVDVVHLTPSLSTYGFGDGCGGMQSATG
jgi:hypothetical protein